MCTPSATKSIQRLLRQLLLDSPVDVRCARRQAAETGGEGVDFYLLEGRRAVGLLVQHVVGAIEAQHDRLQEQSAL